MMARTNFFIIRFLMENKTKMELQLTETLNGLLIAVFSVGLYRVFGSKEWTDQTLITLIGLINQ